MHAAGYRGVRRDGAKGGRSSSRGRKGEGRTVGAIAAATHLPAQIIHHVLNVVETAVLDITAVAVARAALTADAAQQFKGVFQWVFVVIVAVPVIVVLPGGLRPEARGAAERGRKAAKAVLVVRRVAP